MHAFLWPSCSWVLVGYVSRFIISHQHLDYYGKQQFCQSYVCITTNIKHSNFNRSLIFLDSIAVRLCDPQANPTLTLSSTCMQHASLYNYPTIYATIYNYIQLYLRFMRVVLKSASSNSPPWQAGPGRSARTTRHHEAQQLKNSLVLLLTSAVRLAPGQRSHGVPLGVSDCGYMVGSDRLKIV